MRAFLILLALGCPIAAAEPVTFHGTPPDGLVRRYGDDRFRVTAEVHGLAMSPDGKRLAVLATSDQRQQAVVTIFDVETRRPLAVSRLNQNGWGVFSTPGMAFSPDGKLVAVVLNEDTAFALAADTGREVWRSKNDPQSASGRCAFDPTGRLIRTFQNETRVQELPSGKVVARWPVGGIAALTPDAKTFVKVAAEFATVVIGDTATGQVRHTIDVRTAQNGADNGLAVSHDGTTLAVVHDRKELRLFDLATGRPRRAWPLPAKSIDPNNPQYTVSFSRDDATVFLACQNQPIGRWDAATGAARPPLQPHEKWWSHHAVHDTADGRTVLAVSSATVIDR